MVKINPDTGYYTGREFERNGELMVGDCVPTAVGNYLILYGIPKKTVQKIVRGIMTHPRYKGYGPNTAAAAKIIEDVLKEHLYENIQVRLHTTFPQEVVPEQYRTYVKSIARGTKISLSEPLIAFTDFKDNQHLWVAKDSPPQRIDCDGEIHDDLYVIRGYLQIEVLKEKNQAETGI